MSSPAQSRPWAMQDYPHARQSELQALLQQSDIQPGQRIVDLQAAGGYLADAIYEQLQGDVEIICVEPTELHRRIRACHQVCTDEIDRLISITSGSIDRVIGLAGLHHSRDVQATLLEVMRILKPGGCFSVCDVVQGSVMDRWLNEFVDQHTPGGHKGTFFSPGELSRKMLLSGFIDVHEKLKPVPWHFASERDMYRFMQGLFGLELEQSVLEQCLPEFLNWSLREDGSAVLDWDLSYAVGYKP